MKRVVIFGATSSIAQASARIWAKEHAAFVLCGRELERLKTVASDLRALGAAEVDVVSFDGGDPASCSGAVKESLGKGCNIALLAHGVLTDQERARSDVAYLAETITINFVSFAVIAEALAAHFERQKSGSLVLIGSVAGDRGRASNYLYGSAKAGVAALASGLRGRLSKVGVDVITVKPGFVDTPMTAHLKKGLLFASAEVVGKAICDAVADRRQIIYTPWFWRWIMGILAHVPERLFHRLPI